MGRGRQVNQAIVKILVSNHHKLILVKWWKFEQDSSNYLLNIKKRLILQFQFRPQPVGICQILHIVTQIKTVKSVFLKSFKNGLSYLTKIFST